MHAYVNLFLCFDTDSPTHHCMLSPLLSLSCSSLFSLFISSMFPLSSVSLLSSYVSLFFPLLHLQHIPPMIELHYIFTYHRPPPPVKEIHYVQFLLWSNALGTIYGGGMSESNGIMNALVCFSLDSFNPSSFSLITQNSFFCQVGKCL